MKKYATTQDMLNAFQKAWSTQDKDGIVSFFDEQLSFEDIPIGLHASNKEELYELLDVTFKGVPDFTMEIIEFYTLGEIIVTKWKQSGSMTVKGYGLNLTNFPYEVITTSIIKVNKNGLITSVSDNWNTGIFYQ